MYYHTSCSSIVNFQETGRGSFGKVSTPSHLKEPTKEREMGGFNSLVHPLSHVLWVEICPKVVSSQEKMLRKLDPMPCGVFFIQV